MAALVFQGSPASVDVVRSGFVYFPAGAVANTLINVADINIKSDSVVICWGVGTADTTALSFIVDVVTASTGFSIRSVNAVNAAKTVGFAVLKY